MSPETIRKLRTLRWILKRTLDPDDCEIVLGDLEEFHNEIETTHGPRAALRWHIAQVVRTIPHLLIHQFTYPKAPAGRPIRGQNRFTA